VGMPEGMSGRGGWQVNLSRPLQDFGEPLLNRERQVLGFIAERELFYPISQLLNSAEKVMRAGGDIRTGWLGVYVEVDEAQSSAQIAGAIRVSRVEEGGPASKAGLMPGDILKKWNGREVENAWDFIRNVQDTPVGSQAAVEVLRQGRPLTLTALIEARKPQPVQERFVFSFPETAEPRPPADISVQTLEVFGIDTLALTPQLARSLRLPVQSGLLVSDVELRQAFDKAGVQVGDVIVLVDGRPVASPAYFYSHMQSRGSGARLLLKLLRRGEERTTTIQLPSGPSARP
jgi:serine protease Do